MWTKLHFKVIYCSAIEEEALHNFIIPESREGLAWGARRTYWVVEEGTKHLYLQPSLPRREIDPDRVMIHRIAIPGLLDQILHFLILKTENNPNEP